MSRISRSLIVVLCASIGLPSVRSATAQPPQATPAAAPQQEVVAPAESVPAVPPLAPPTLASPAAEASQVPATEAPTSESLRVNSREDAAAHEKIAQVLNATAEVEFNQTPLSEVASYLQETYQIPIIIDRRALDTVGMGSDTPVTMSMRGISLRSVLKHMLHELDLTYVVCNQVLKITTPDEAENQMEVRVYPVADLAVAPRPSLVVGEPESDFRTIQRVVSSNVAPNSWDEVGGAAKFWSFDPWGILTVSQTRENHEALACLLAAVRQTRRLTAGAKEPQADWQPIPVASDAELGAHARIEQALNSMATVEFLETPLSEVASYLRDTHQIPVILDKRALDDVGMGSDTPVTTSIHGISVRSALNLLLKELELTYVVRDEVLIITTPETSQRELPMFVYPVSDFLVPTSEPLDSRMPGRALSSLLDMIESTVMPDTWDHVGGAGCISTIEPWGILVISQTEEVQERVNNLLQTARRARHAAPAVAGGPQSLTPTIQLPLGAPLVPPTPPTVLPRTAVPASPLSPPLDVPGPVAAAATRSFLPFEGGAMILKVYAVPDFDAEQLMTAIRSVVASETWGNGADRGAMFPLGVQVLIRQTPANHAVIRELIDGLRPHKVGR